MEKLKEIIEDLKQVSKETEVRPDDNVLFDCAVRILNAGNINKPENRGFPRRDAPATDRQKAFMKKLGLTIPAGITSKEASKVIDGKVKALEERKNENNIEDESYEEEYY